MNWRRRINGFFLLSELEASCRSQHFFLNLQFFNRFSRLGTIFIKFVETRSSYHLSHILLFTLLSYLDLTFLIFIERIDCFITLKNHKLITYNKLSTLSSYETNPPFPLIGSGIFYWGGLLIGKVGMSASYWFFLGGYGWSLYAVLFMGGTLGTFLTSYLSSCAFIYCMLGFVGGGPPLYSVSYLPPMAEL